MQSKVNGVGPGAGVVNAHGASGAGHGGYGGKGYLQNIRGGYYNSLLQPSMFGSSGGGGNTAGGGVLRINCNVLRLDGDVKLNGQIGSSVAGSFNGGASGGSAWVTASEFEGSGSLVADGGSGDSLSGGGSGGRIAIHYSVSNKFEGTLTAYGGDSSHETGAAGTIVVTNTGSGATNLTVSNKGRKPSSMRITDFAKLSLDSARTWIPLSAVSPKPTYTSSIVGDTAVQYLIEHSFNTLTLGGSSHIAFEANKHSYTSTVVINRLLGTFEGKSYGYIHSAARQFIVIKSSDFYLPVNLQVYSSGAVQLPSKVMLHRNDLNLQGSLAGLKELTLSAGTLRLSSSSKVGYALSGAAGIDLTKLVVLAGASVVAPADTLLAYSIKSAYLSIEAGGSIAGRSLYIETDVCVVQDSSTISVDSGGYTKSQGRGFGPTDLRAKESSGGSHAGYGGCPTSLARGLPYGNMFQPSLAGSGGGGLSAVTGGAEGGGSIKLLAKSLSIHGTISAK